MSIEVRVAGERFSGFLSGSLTLSMDDPVNAFELSYAASGDSIEERALFEGDEIEFWMHGEQMLGGYVETLDEDDQVEQVSLRAIGSSKTTDLSCSAAQLGFTNAKISTIASALCTPSGISVYVQGDEGAAFASFHTQSGESVIETIQRAATKRGLFAYAVGSDLVLARAGVRETATQLVRGQLPLMRSSRSSSWFDRYSDYVFRGQMRGTEHDWGKRSGQLKHAVRDPTINRYRPLLMQAEAHAPGDLKTRAELERNTRAARGERVTALVSGHQMAEGFCWRPNVLVQFSNPALRVDAQLIITRVVFRFGADEADATELEMTRPEAYSLVDYPTLYRGEPWR